MCFEIAVKPNSYEMEMSQKWIMANFGEEASVLPFSFVYGGQSSAGLLKTWKAERATKELDESRTQQTLTFTDSKTGLEVRCVIVEYKDFPTVEWTVYLKNIGSTDTPFIDNIQALDIRLERDETDSEFLLHHNVGSPANRSDYAPLETPLSVLAMKRISSSGVGTAGGRPSDSDWPYFNLAWGVEGMIIVVG